MSPTVMWTAFIGLVVLALMAFSYLQDKRAERDFKKRMREIHQSTY
jgi:hypothetical protein